MRKDIRCILSFHHFVRKHDAHPETPSAFYYECSRCGKFRDVPFRPGLPG